MGTAVRHGLLAWQFTLQPVLYRHLALCL